MKTLHCHHAGAFALVMLVALAGCNEDARRPDTRPKDNPVKAVEAKKAPAGKNVFLEIEGDRRRVLVNAEVCKRDMPNYGEGFGGLGYEGLLTRKGAKEHEYILAADVDARDIHKALLAAGANPGSPVRFQPRYYPPSGTVIKVSFQYDQGGKRITDQPKHWVRLVKGDKEYDRQWVFAGSRFYDDPEGPDKPQLYAANQGDLISFENMEQAMLDVTVRDDDTLGHRPWTVSERVPPLGTKVVVILEPVLDAKK
jgi:hypothetical protein